MPSWPDSYQTPSPSTPAGRTAEPSRTSHRRSDFDHVPPVILARMSREREGIRWGRIILIAAVLLIINVPYALYQWRLHQVATSGDKVTATVVGVSRPADDMDVAFRLPASVDKEQKVRTVRLHREVAEEAARTRELEVRVQPGNPDLFHVEGQVRSWGGLILIMVADALVAMMLLIAWRFGGRLRRPTLVGIAVEDVRDGDEGSLLDKQDDGTYLINGEVASAGPSSLILTLRDRDVEIHLRDHENPIAVGQRARVRAQLVG